MSDAPVIVLLSLGRHPVSGRARRAERDARALTMALGSGLPVIGLHAGAPHEALRDYLGMGLKRLLRLDVPDGGDPVSALAAFISSATVRPRLVLAGSIAEAGAASGMVPYLVAEALGLPLAPGVASLRTNQDGFEFVQALPRGGRRSLHGTNGIVATVDLQGPRPRQVARGPALRGTMQRASVTATQSIPLLLPEVSQAHPARARPKRIGPTAAQAADGERRLLIDPTPREAAQEILKFLESERLLPRRQAAGARKLEETP